VFLPDMLALTMGLALGWVLAGMFIFKPRGPMQYQKAVKLLRKSEFADAVKEMDALIREEPQDPNHYRFRAEILRVWGKLDRARRDYEKMTQLAPDSAVAFNGLAEVTLQAGRYDEARVAALKAFELAPDEWVAAYNLGMIEDRLGEAEGAAEHLNLALQQRIGDVRHRMLIHFYLVRAYARLGQMEDADAAVQAIRKHRSGLDEWQVILDSPQAATLRAVIADDVAAAARLADDQMTPVELV
jgi:tetratricopeptide (TPR) repeat protein